MSSGRGIGLAWRRAAGLWRGLRGRRRTAVTATELLRPGIYRPLSETLWARSGAPLPVHLLRTKGRGPSGTGEVSSRYRLFRLIGGTFMVLDPRRAGTAELVVVSFDGGTVVLDQVHGRVHRTYGTGPMTAVEERRRRLFTDHVSAPRFRVGREGASIEEELVEGAHLDDLSPDAQAGLLTTLVEQFAALTAACIGDAPTVTAPPTVTDQELQLLLAGADVPPGFERAWGSASQDWFSPQTPWIPSPREANAKNLVVRPDGRPAPIDLGDLQVDPYFTYPAGILIAAGGETMRRFLSGEEDYSFPLLFENAGRRWGATSSERRGLLLSRIVYAAHKDSRVGAEIDPGEFEASLRRRWAEVSEVFVAASGGSAGPERHRS